MASTTLQWLSLVGIIWLQAINGTNTNFPSYSTQLKQTLSISQVQLNNLAFASDAGKLLGFLSGMASVRLPLWLVLIAGSTLGLIGYGLQYLLITNHIISSLSYWHVFFLTLIAGNSICWINTVCYVIALKNFPSDQQVAVGLSTSYQGLSAKIYTEIVDLVSPHRKAQAFLLLNSILPLIVSLIAIPVTREIEVAEPNRLGVGFVLMFIITIPTGLYAVLNRLQFLSSKLSSESNMIGMLVSLLLPLFVPIFQKINDPDEKSRIIKDSEIEKEDSCRDFVRVREEIGVKLMLRRIDFWLYFFVYFFGATLGLVYLSNLGQIAESRGSSTSSLVSLSSSFGFFGRLLPSLMDYFCRGKDQISRTASTLVLMIPITGSFFLLLDKTELALYTSTAIIGMCTGAITSISVSTTTELFGTKNFSVNHNVVVANIPIGSFLFGFLAALVYRKQKGGDGKCMGMECYKSTFTIWGSLCFFGTFLAFILCARTRKFYSQKQ